MSEVELLGKLIELGIDVGRIKGERDALREEVKFLRSELVKAPVWLVPEDTSEDDRRVA